MPGENIQDWSIIAANNGAADSSINWAEGQARASVNNSARSEMAAHAKDRNLKNGSIVTGGTANAQTFTSGVTYTVVPTGLRVLLKIGPSLTNTGAATLNMDGIGPVAIKNKFGTDLLAYDLAAGSYAEFVYNGTNWIALQEPVNGPVLLATKVASGTAVDFTTDIDANYDEYLFVLVGMRPSGVGSLSAYLSTDGGASYIITDYWWGMTHASSSSAVTSGSYGSVILGGDALLRFQIGIGQEAGVAQHVLDGEFRLFRPSIVGAYKHAIWHTVTVNSSAGLGAVSTVGGGTNVSTISAVNAVRFSYTAGTIVGTIYMYGLRK